MYAAAARQIFMPSCGRSTIPWPRAGGLRSTFPWPRAVGLVPPLADEGDEGGVAAAGGGPGAAAAAGGAAAGCGAAAAAGGDEAAAAAGGRFRGVFGAPGAPGAKVHPFFFPFSTAPMSLAADEARPGTHDLSQNAG